ncbi:hypothetical protein QBC47DRAFT_411908 [Echria macrotheca]|uniref:Uncharacterized protein n=1 Tax=Echria macrotheca TaxID=438768 RepID=A0AAJ0FDP4_9PEZI|nr:hypothetical protein QBC47DRAFT_411908 [Echria macrotheca]
MTSTTITAPYSTATSTTLYPKDETGPRGLLAWTFVTARLLSILTLISLLSVDCALFTTGSASCNKIPGGRTQAVLVGTVGLAIIALGWSITSLVARGWSSRYVSYGFSLVIDAVLLAGFIAVAVVLGTIVSKLGTGDCVELVVVWGLVMAVPGLLVITAGNVVCFRLEGEQEQQSGGDLVVGPYQWVQGVDSRFGGSGPPSRWQPSTVQEPRSVRTAEMVNHQNAAGWAQEIPSPIHRTQAPIQVTEIVTSRTDDGWWVREPQTGGGIPGPAQKRLSPVRTAEMAAHRDPARRDQDFPSSVVRKPRSPTRTPEMVTRRTPDGWWIQEDQSGGSVRVPSSTREPRSPIRPPEIAADRYPAKNNAEQSRKTPDLAEFFANLLRRPLTPEDRG